jgi:hypothetical protein
MRYVFPMRKGIGLLTGGVVFSLCVYGLTAQNLPRSDSSTFDRYTTCKFADGLTVVETAPLAPGIHARTVETSKGPRQVEMVEGRRVMFAYPDKDFYANVKVEILPEKNYVETRQFLIDSFDYTLASGSRNTRNYGLKPMLNGLDVRGLDRDKPEGGVAWFVSAAGRCFEDGDYNLFSESGTEGPELSDYRGVSRDAGPISWNLYGLYWGKAIELYSHLIVDNVNYIN